MTSVFFSKILNKSFFNEKNFRFLLEKSFLKFNLIVLLYLISFKENKNNKSNALNDFYKNSKKLLSKIQNLDLGKENFSLKEFQKSFSSIVFHHLANKNKLEDEKNVDPIYNILHSNAFKNIMFVIRNSKDINSLKNIFEKGLLELSDFSDLNIIDFSKRRHEEDLQEHKRFLANLEKNKENVERIKGITERIDKRLAYSK